jgi:LPS export ABC transporter permease LptG/LPS export ABC transporter permease LptF
MIRPVILRIRYHRTWPKIGTWGVFRIKILDRYFLREIIPPFGLGLLVYSFVLLANQILQYPELFIAQGVSFTDSTKLLVYLIPAILAFTIPMAVIMGILAGLGRMSSDSESVAFKSLGVSHVRMARPLFIFALFGWAATSVLTLYVTPRFNYLWLQTTVSAVLDKTQIQVTAREFNPSVPGLVLYLEDIGRNGDWEKAFISFNGAPNESLIVMADRGRLNYDPGTKRAEVELFNAIQHLSRADDPQYYEWGSMSSTRKEIDFSGLANAFSSEKRAREQNIDELRAGLAAARTAAVRLKAEKEDLVRRGVAAGSPESQKNDFAIGQKNREIRNLLVERQKRFALPFVCLIFVLMGLPLGLSTKKGGRTSGFTISLVIILAYYIFITFGEGQALAGRVAPWLGIWGGNIVFGVASLILFIRSARERPFLIKWVQRPLAPVTAGNDGPAAEAAPRTGPGKNDVASTGDRPRRFRIRLPFPNILDRYFIRRYLWIGGLILLSVVSIFCIVTFFDRLATVNAHNKPITMLLEYISHRIPEFFQLGLPMTALMATLLTLGVFYKFNEITAMKACGISVFRMIVPAFVLAVIIGGLSFMIQEDVLPRETQKAAEVWDRINDVTTPASGMQGFSWKANRARDRFFNYEYFDPKKMTFRKLWVFEIDPVRWELKRRIFAASARLADQTLVLEKGWTRDFQGSIFSRPPDPAFFKTAEIPLPEGSGLFLSKAKDPSRMKYGELGRYITEVEQLGFNTTRLKVDRSSKLSFPFVAVIMTLLGIPFAFAMGKSGALVGIGVSLGVALVFWTTIGIFKSLGGVGILPVFLAAWGPALLFGILGLYLTLRLKT